MLTAGLFLWGAYLCLWNIGAANTHVDERIYVRAGWAYLHGDFSPNREHPPTAKYLYGLVQVLFGEGVLAPRVLAGLLTLAVAVILWIWLRREVGFTRALLPVALWLLLPRGLDGGGERLDRFALLEPVMIVCTVGAMACAWQWFRSGRWPWIAASGMLMGCAITSKVSAASVLVGFLVLLVARRPPRRVARDVAVFVIALAVTAVGLYLPMGMADAVGFMMRMQSEHNAAGHLVTVAGITGAFPPWWGNLWFTAVGVGIPTTVVLTIGLLGMAVAGHPGRLHLFVAVALGALLAFHLFGTNVALPHYYSAWFWMLAVLAGLGLAALISPRSERPSPVGVHPKPTVPGPARSPARGIAGWSGAVVGAAALLLVVAIATRLTVYTWQERARGLALVEAALAADPAADGDVLIAGMAPWEYAPYIARDDAIGDPGTVDGADVRAILVKESPRFGVDARVRAFVDNTDRGVRMLQLDDVTVYILEARLISPGDTLVLEQ